MSERHSLIAFVSCLVAILALAGCASLAINKGKSAEAYQAAIVGLIGVIGTFRPRSSGLSEENEGKVIDKLPPPTGEAAQAEQP